MLKKSSALFLSACFFLSIGFFCAPLYGSPADEIQTAAGLYPTEPARAMEMLLSTYRQQKTVLPLIKSILYEKQYHQFYSDFLDRIPPGKETADEKLQMTLILGRKDGFLTALSNYLQYYPVDSVADKYPDLLLKNDAYLEILNANYSKELFQIMKTAAIRMKKISQFDSFLASSATNGKIGPQDVKKYILESWPYKQRDLQALLDGFRIGADTDLAVFKVYFSFLSGDYKKALDDYPALYLASQKKENQVKALQIDLPYVFFTALFREGRYTDALRDIRRDYFPEKNDLPELRYLSFIGLGDGKNASAEIASMKNESKVYFYTGMDLVLENPTNGAEYFEKYIQDLDESQRYLSAALLVYYAMVKKPDRTAVTADLVKHSMLFRETAPVSDLPLSYAFSRDTAGAGQPAPNGTIGNYIRYRQALEWARSDKKEEAKKAVFELVRTTNTSPVIRSLAAYRARELE